MDYRKFVQSHVDSNADVTVAVQPASRADAPALGILKLSGSGEIVQFKEKPTEAAELDALTSTDDPEKAIYGIDGDLCVQNGGAQ